MLNMCFVFVIPKDACTALTHMWVCVSVCLCWFSVYMCVCACATIGVEKYGTVEIAFWRGGEPICANSNL